MAGFILSFETYILGLLCCVLLVFISEWIGKRWNVTVKGWYIIVGVIIYFITCLYLGDIFAKYLVFNKFLSIKTTFDFFLLVVVIVIILLFCNIYIIMQLYEFLELMSNDIINKMYANRIKNKKLEELSSEELREYLNKNLKGESFIIELILSLVSKLQYIYKNDTYYKHVIIEALVSLDKVINIISKMGDLKETERIKITKVIKNIINDITVIINKNSEFVKELENIENLNEIINKN